MAHSAWRPNSPSATREGKAQKRDRCCTLLGHFRSIFVPKADSRIAITVSSGAHQFLLEWWAALTGRSQANLASALLEKALTDALRNGDIPHVAVSAYDKFIDAMGVHLAEEFQEAIDSVKEGMPL